MTLHHTKHHQTYVNGLNAAEESLASVFEKGDVLAQLKLQSVREIAYSSAKRLLTWPSFLHSFSMIT